MQIKKGDVRPLHEIKSLYLSNLWYNEKIVLKGQLWSGY